MLKYWLIPIRPGKWFKKEQILGVKSLKSDDISKNGRLNGN